MQREYIACMGGILLAYDPVAGSCESANEPSGFVKGGKFLD
jgi:hypothetical protein